MKLCPLVVELCKVKVRKKSIFFKFLTTLLWKIPVNAGLITFHWNFYQFFLNSIECSVKSSRSPAFAVIEILPIKVEKYLFFIFEKITFWIFKNRRLSRTSLHQLCFVDHHSGNFWRKYEKNQSPRVLRSTPLNTKKRHFYV